MRPIPGQHHDYNCGAATPLAINNPQPKKQRLNSKQNDSTAGESQTRYESTNFEAVQQSCSKSSGYLSFELHMRDAVFNRYSL
ncbi:hypothetical protein SERLA73DRAFT_134057 [Serpula lacrymans var. lacrymans S7.3]|uniref:Uncharacterized protein n=2 Tax=Serpula lacrymans var. lacrymans TaxID=341189 RepID=F8PT98_SERL3|nr:uncharacterized protein SERLADRAFT_385339 [Serpula lacrymans var. lacrymans S7.9]EGO00928.1 hypothetical protein SERLA73DRAFT_134057 [Serpula lacrymans var. lacrymans S7.3]EGO26549.1 hypothetical protein SERLADRAFT_385339 [Serpula lacrymans var. lacrymans S7.9]